MDLLSNHPNAYIRPSPTGNVMGGVTNSTRESIAILQSGGFDIIFIETVGVGQSEYIVRSMCDIFLLLYQPGSGDDLQGIKKGIIEIADFIAVTKDDGDNQKIVRDSISYIKNALSISKDKNIIVCSISAYTGKGIDELWDRLMSLFYGMTSNGQLLDLRLKQKEQWIKDIALNYITNDFNRYLKTKKELNISEKSIFALARNLNAEFMESGYENFTRDT
jgi:LAO/AO transport system kinase